jgi:hypothetical protein
MNFFFKKWPDFGLRTYPALRMPRKSLVSLTSS